MSVSFLVTAIAAGAIIKRRMARAQWGHVTAGIVYELSGVNRSRSFGMAPLLHTGGSTTGISVTGTPGFIGDWSSVLTIHATVRRIPDSLETWSRSERRGRT